MGWPELNAAAERHYGLIHIPSARDYDVDPAEVRREAREKRWRRPAPRVVSLPGAPDTHEQRAAAQTLSMGDDAVVTRWTAMYLYGLIPNAPTRVDVVVKNGRRAPDRHTVRVLRSRTVREDDRTVVKGIPCASVARALLDLASICNLPRLRSLVIDAVQRRLVTIAQIADRMIGIGKGVTGTKKLRRILYELDAETCDSVFELRVRKALRAAGFDIDRAPVAVEGRTRTLHVDIGIRERKLGVECLGMRAHSTRTQLAKDARRMNDLAFAPGWLFLSIDYDRFEHDWEGFLDELRAAVERSEPR